MRKSNSGPDGESVILNAAERSEQPALNGVKGSHSRARYAVEDRQVATRDSSLSFRMTEAGPDTSRGTDDAAGMAGNHDP
jgi:hypothetical protein